jgi:polyisoprenoid-binding protein YceI
MKSTIVMMTLALATSSIATGAEYKVDNEKSELKWTATKVTGAHNGTVPVSSGMLDFKDGMITKGRLEIDMNGIKVDDIKDPKYNADLTQHLKSDDFFSVDKNPKAVFEITSAKKVEGGMYELSGKLQIKGETKPLPNPVKVKVSQEGDKVLKLAGELKLDRTAWNIRYKSGKFFPNLGDKMIHDEFTINFNVTSKLDAGSTKKSGKY